jgi:hypothetical protein
MKPYPLVDDLLRPLLGVAMPRAGPLYAPRGRRRTVPVPPQIQAVGA